MENSEEQLATGVEAPAKSEDTAENSEVSEEPAEQEDAPNELGGDESESDGAEAK